mgnify:CR=1 FL=1
MSMTNEKLAELIKSGQKEYCADLWEQTRKIFTKKANRFYNFNRLQCDRCGLMIEDLIQICYFAMLEAVRAYNPEKEYKFTTYINFHFRNAMREAVGIRGAGRQNLLNECSSLDIPIGEDEETALLEFVEDKEAYAAFDRSDTAQTLDKLRILLDEAIDYLPPIHAEILRLRYFGGVTYTEIAERLGMKTIQGVKNLEANAFRRIATSRHKRILQEYRDIELSDRAYHSTGLTSFMYKGASSQELAVEYADRLTERSNE